jgi:hypothetical protein
MSNEEHKVVAQNEGPMKAIGKQRRKQIKQLGKASFAAQPTKELRQEDSSAVQARMEQDHNARMYYASVCDPWNVTGQRLPDLTMVPTGVQTDRMPGFMGMVNGSGSDRVGALAIRPWPYQGITTLTTVPPPVSSANFTLDSFASSPNLTDFQTRYSALRAISMGVTIVDYGKLLDRGVLFYAFRVPLEYSLSNLNISTLRGFPEQCVIPISDEGEAQFVWLPIDGKLMYDYNAANKALPLFTTWTDPTYAANSAYTGVVSSFAGIESQLLLVAVSFDTTVTDDFAVDVVVNYETMPFFNYERTVDRKVALGGDESIAVAARDLSNERSGILQMVRTGQSAGKKVMKWINNPKNGLSKVFGGVKNLGKAAMKQVLDNPMQTLSMLSAFADPKKEEKRATLHRIILDTGHVVSGKHPYVMQLAELELHDAIMALMTMLESDLRLDELTNWDRTTHLQLPAQFRIVSK